LKKANELAKGSISRYVDTYDHLKNYLSKIKNTDFLLTEVNFKFIKDFDLYLRQQKSHRSGISLERNTINKHHSRLRTILIRAINEGSLIKNPYAEFKFKYLPSNRTFLTEEELKKISDYSFSHNLSLERVRDIFLFSVYTGLRFYDAQHLKSQQIFRDKNENLFINLIQEKTHHQIQIPLLKPAHEIFKKYENTERKITGNVLPRISNQKFNLYLREIGNIVGITKPLSHHVARHTCATTILLSKEAPIEAVSKWLGHASIRTTQIYAKITNNYLAEIAKKIENKI